MSETTKCHKCGCTDRRLFTIIEAMNQKKLLWCVCRATENYILN
jgi:hypothetical protein